ncbi:hypothetical protein DND132_1902 [Pseudodesulfovibrio mercurii]|uniref:Teneurin-like YD-shell domain-containing protein n=1 Tax=Pseudodesulfovibrio mercurii TaxID=641491 RepID=F0JGR8_9BACT|nr:hypothetical protein DND132_1902 [Pseudodesulfovibrio mercurii]
MPRPEENAQLHHSRKPSASAVKEPLSSSVGLEDSPTAEGPEAFLVQRVVADVDDNVIKEILYDPFGGIIEDTNPSLRLPIGFAGGLHDRDLGFVRFGWRDYDVRTGRWTAPDPIGDKGGDPDW